MKVGSSMYFQLWIFYFEHVHWIFVQADSLCPFLDWCEIGSFVLPSAVSCSAHRVVSLSVVFISLPPPNVSFLIAATLLFVICVFSFLVLVCFINRIASKRAHSRKSQKISTNDQKMTPPKSAGRGSGSPDRPSGLTSFDIGQITLKRPARQALPVIRQPSVRCSGPRPFPSRSSVLI